MILVKYLIIYYYYCYIINIDICDRLLLNQNIYCIYFFHPLKSPCHPLATYIEYEYFSRSARITVIRDKPQSTLTG